MIICHFLDQQCSYPKLLLLWLMSKPLTAAGAILGNIHADGSLLYVHTILKCSFFLFHQAYLETSGILAVFSGSPSVSKFSDVSHFLFIGPKKIKVLWSSVKQQSRCWRLLDLVLSARSGRKWSAVISALCWMNAGPSFKNTTKKPSIFAYFLKVF